MSREKRRCLGLNCQKMVEKPDWFCPKCKARKKKAERGWGRLLRAKSPGKERRRKVIS